MPVTTLSDKRNAHAYIGLVSIRYLIQVGSKTYYNLNIIKRCLGFLSKKTELPHSP